MDFEELNNKCFSECFWSKIWS